MSAPTPLMSSSRGYLQRLHRPAQRVCGDRTLAGAAILGTLLAICCCSLFIYVRPNLAGLQLMGLRIGSGRAQNVVTAVTALSVVTQSCVYGPLVGFGRNGVW
jgi:hypothetical protein